MQNKQATTTARLCMQKQREFIYLTNVCIQYPCHSVYTIIVLYTVILATYNQYNTMKFLSNNLYPHTRKYVQYTCNIPDQRLNILSHIPMHPVNIVCLYVKPKCGGPQHQHPARVSLSNRDCVLSKLCAKCNSEGWPTVYSEKKGMLTVLLQ